MRPPDIPDERALVPYEASRFDARRVLVLAPHPDDEVFGCGGALADLASRGATIDVLLVTDGAAGASDEAGRRAIAARRADESRAALAHLGGGSRARGRPARPRPRRRARRSSSGSSRPGSSQAAPDLVFCPSPVETHPDHRAVAYALLAVARRPAPDPAAAALARAHGRVLRGLAAVPAELPRGRHAGSRAQAEGRPRLRVAGRRARLRGLRRRPERVPAHDAAAGLGGGRGLRRVPGSASSPIPRPSWAPSCPWARGRPWAFGSASESSSRDACPESGRRTYDGGRQTPCRPVRLGGRGLGKGVALEGLEAVPGASRESRKWVRTTFPAHFVGPASSAPSRSPGLLSSSLRLRSRREAAVAATAVVAAVAATVAVAAAATAAAAAATVAAAAAAAVAASGSRGGSGSAAGARTRAVAAARIRAAADGRRTRVRNSHLGDPAPVMRGGPSRPVRRTAAAPAHGGATRRLSTIGGHYYGGYRGYYPLLGLGRLGLGLGLGLRAVLVHVVVGRPVGRLEHLRRAGLRGRRQRRCRRAARPLCGRQDGRVAAGGAGLPRRQVHRLGRRLRRHPGLPLPRTGQVPARVPPAELHDVRDRPRRHGRPADQDRGEAQARARQERARRVPAGEQGHAARARVHEGRRRRRAPPRRAATTAGATANAAPSWRDPRTKSARTCASRRRRRARRTAGGSSSA